MRRATVLLVVLVGAVVVDSHARSLLGESTTPAVDGQMTMEANEDKAHQSSARVAFDEPGAQLAHTEPIEEFRPDTTAPIVASQPVFLVNIECLDGSIREDSHVGSVIDCRSLCQDEPACRAFTYNSYTEICYLAATCDTRGEEIGRISGEVLPVGSQVQSVPDEKEDYSETSPSEESDASSDVDDPVVTDIKQNDVPTQEPETTTLSVKKIEVESREYSLFSDTECAVQQVLAERSGIASVSECQEECDKRHRKCGAFTFNPNSNKCFLVSDCHDRRREAGNVSGVEASIVSKPFLEESDEEVEFNTYPDTSCADEAIRELADVSLPDECQQLCAAEQACKAYTHHSDTKRCVLTASCTARETEEGSTSGVEISTDQPSTGYNLYEGTGCTGETLLFKSDVPSVAACQAWCEKRHWQGCGAFVYVPDRNRCYLKSNCNRREIQKDNISGVKLEVDECTVSSTCSTDDPDKVCLEVTKTTGELADPVVGTFEPPYAGIRYRPTYRKRKEYPTCNFQPPRDPLPNDWVDQCIENARGVGFLRERKRRPNDECPAGWFLCKGMCYTLSQRNNRGPERDEDYYVDDFMFVESRCGLCGGARVAFVGDDPDMQRVAAEAARQTINEDKATWVRRFRFLEDRNRKVQRGRPYQPWHLYVEMYNDDKRKATYQRYYTGEKDGRRDPGWDARFRNQEGSILCVNTIPRIQQAVKYPDDSNLTMERGCRGANHHEMWDNDEHRWRPERHYPFPGH